MTALKDIKTYAALAEKRIRNLRAIVNSQTTNTLLVSNANLAFNIPGLSADAADDAASVACSSISRSSPFPTYDSQAKKTIELNTPIPPLEWVWGNCLGCNSAHRYRATGSTDIVSPNRNRPDVAEAAAANVIKLCAEHKSKGGGGGDRGSKPYQGKNPSLDRSYKEQKTSYVFSLLVE